MLIFDYELKQPTPTIYSRSSRIIAVTSAVIILLLIIAIIARCVKSFYVDITDSPIAILFIIGYILCISSIVNMFSQQISLRIRRINQYAICIPYAILAIVLLAGYVINIFLKEQYRQYLAGIKLGLISVDIEAILMEIAICIATISPIIAWLTNTALVIRSMIKSTTFAPTNLKDIHNKDYSVV